MVSFEAGDDSVALSLSAYRAFTRDYIVQANYTETSVKVVGARDSAVSQVLYRIGDGASFPFVDPHVFERTQPSESTTIVR